MKRAIIVAAIALLVPPGAEAATKSPFKLRHPILYWVVAGPAYPFRHPIKTSRGLAFPIAHPCKFGKMYQESGISGLIQFGADAALIGGGTRLLTTGKGF